MSTASCGQRVMRKLDATRFAVVGALTFVLFVVYAHAWDSAQGRCDSGAMPPKGPAHKNTFAFKHNKHSRKTKFIAGLPTQRASGSGLCERWYGYRTDGR
jgi:hypothetical protein